MEPCWKPVRAHVRLRSGWHACKPSLVTPWPCRTAGSEPCLGHLSVLCSPVSPALLDIVAGGATLGVGGVCARPPPPKRQSHAKRAQCLRWRVSEFPPSLSCERGQRRPPRFPFSALEFYHRPPIHVDPGIDQAAAAVRRAFRETPRKWLSRSPLL